MSTIKDYFDSIITTKSTEDIAKSVMAAEKRPESSRMRFKPLAVAAAAAVVLVGGVTAAAATGLIDFNEIFGGRITATDEQLAGELIGAAQDFTWSVSDDDYMIELKGITGSKSDMLLVYEIARSDGKPVTDFMTNIPEDGILKGLVDYGHSYKDSYSCFLNTEQYTINGQGNIEVCNQIITDGSLAGCHYSVETTNLYPEEDLYTFCGENEIIMKTERYNSDDKSIGFYNDNYDTPSDIALNDERIIGLELTWSVDFTYSPSDTAALSKSISGEETVVSLNRWKTYAKNENETFDCKITKSQFSCVGGWIDVKYNGASSGVLYDELNEVYLLMADGGRVPCVFDSLGHNTCYEGNTETTLRTVVRYSETLDGPITAIDISEITAVSINGEIFPLA